MKRSQMLKTMSIDPNIHRTEDVLLFLIENKTKVEFYLSEALRRYDEQQMGVFNDRLAFERARQVRQVYALKAMRDILTTLGGFSLEESEIEVDVLEKLGYNIRSYLN
jgi:hypothetical protein